MVSRLVLGCGGVGQRLVGRAADWTGSTRVVTVDEERVEAMYGENVRAEHADPADPEVLRRVGPADVVLVVDPDPDRALAIAGTARSVFPSATLLAYAGLNSTDDDRAALSRVADEVIDASRTVGAGIADLVGSRAGLQARRLRRTLQGIDSPLAVVTHDNPDPDAIASAVALVRLAGAVGVDATPCYFGSITHQENRALVNLLDIDLRRLGPDDDLSEFGGVALVDHSRPGVNDQLPADTAVDIVIDHHPPRAPVTAEFADLRSDVGATSTLLTDYLRRFGIDDCGGETVATALLYGIRVDTRELSREVSVADFEAVAALLEHANTGVLDRVEEPDVSPETLDVLSAAIERREVRESVLASCVGRLRDRDALAQAADHLLGMEGVTTTFVYGYDDDTVYASARTRGGPIDIGETLRVAFDELGSGGGHGDMAGAQIPLRSVYRAAGWGGDDDVPVASEALTGVGPDGPDPDPAPDNLAGSDRGPDGAVAPVDGNDEGEAGRDDAGSFPDLDPDERRELVDAVVSNAFFEAVDRQIHAVSRDPGGGGDGTGTDVDVGIDTDIDTVGFVRPTRDLETDPDRE